MPNMLKTTDLCQCSMGVAPTPVNFISNLMVADAAALPFGNMTNFTPFLNIIPFGVCKSMANPVTASLTALAFGVLTPGPCIPTPTGPWLNCSMKALVCNMPAVTDKSMCICAFAGTIKPVMAAPIVQAG